MIAFHDPDSPRSPQLWNADLAPTQDAHRTWTAWHFLALWVGMVMCIPGYMLAAGLIDQGFSAWQAAAMVLAGNAIVLIPMLLNGHAGAKYAIQCWVGGSAIYAVGNILSSGALLGPRIAGIGINAGQLASFMLFWALHLWFIARGPESVRRIDTLTAPVKVVIVLALLAWAWNKAHGFG